MDTKLSLVSYTLAAFAGICFIRGLALFSAEGVEKTCID